MLIFIATSEAETHSYSLIHFTHTEFSSFITFAVWKKISFVPDLEVVARLLDGLALEDAGHAAQVHLVQQRGVEEEGLGRLLGDQEVGLLGQGVLLGDLDIFRGLRDKGKKEGINDRH